MNELVVIGAGIGGLTLALALARAGVPFRIYEAASEIRPLGVGLNLLPHAVRELAKLGLQDALLAKGVETREYGFYTRHGQLIYREPRGRFGGLEWPQISIHRGDLHTTLFEAVRKTTEVHLGHRCTGVEQDAQGVVVHFADRESVRGKAAVACDGINSVVRKQYHPKEAVPRYEGTTQYRGTTRWKPFLSGASMSYLGTFETGKLIIYPIRRDIDAEGRQLVNWVIEIAKPNEELLRDWNRRSEAGEFIAHFEHARFDWLDIPAVLRAADAIYEYPMLDQEPLPHWTDGAVTLLGDAAHPMMPRGSNGSAQAIIDAGTLAALLAKSADWTAALKEYESIRLPATSRVVLANRGIAPDAIIRVVEERTGGKPFARIEDVISQEELAAWQERYKQVAGFSRKDLERKAS